MDGLPSELLRQILRWLRLSSKINQSNDFTAALRVCSKWRDAGERLLWTDVSLEDNTVGRFLSGGGRKDASIMSLTLLIKPLHFEWPEEVVLNDPDLDTSNESPATSALWKRLEKLPQRLRGMESLTSFSFKVCGYTLRHHPEGFWLRTGDICAIVAALPPSVKYLEIDTYCFDRRGYPSVIPGSHLCPRLSSMIPQLTNLRLRVFRLCAELFEFRNEHHTTKVSDVDSSDTAASGLTITINTCDPLSRSSTQSCTRLNGGYPVPWGEEHQCRKMIEDLLERLVRGTLPVGGPQVGHIAFVENFNAPMDAPIARRPYPAMIKRSLFPTKLAKYPYEIFGWNPDVAFLRIRDGTGQDAEVCGRLHDLVDEVEDNSWVETEAGYRLPASLFYERPRFKEMHLKEKEVLSHKEYTQKHLGTSDLWFQELRNGRLLLRMQECDDIHAVGCVEREKTDDEIRKTQYGLDGPVA